MGVTLFLAWQDPKDRSWLPVGRLDFHDGMFRFVYTKGARKSAHFVPFGRMTELAVIYESPSLFPLFANRLLSRQRPEYSDLIRWVNLKEGEDDPLGLLARTGGTRDTDCLEVFPKPEPDCEGRYTLSFFSHGARYLLPTTIDLINEIREGEHLFLMPDPMNPHDRFALALRTENPPVLVGYCPRYLAQDFLRLMDEGRENLTVAVEKVNRDAPLQLRLLCRLSAPWPENFQPCSDEVYEPIPVQPTAQKAS